MTSVATRRPTWVDVDPQPTWELPAWPVLALTWGMPVTWALGLASFSVAMLAVPMLVYLINRRSVLLYPGVLPWLAFVVWVVPCALMLGSFGRFIGYSVRLAQFAGIAVVLVYVTNARQSLPPARLIRALVAMWAAVVVGGYLGMMWPTTRLSFTIGRLLPQAMLANEYVSDLVFPPLAEVQLPYGATEPWLRPSAPFAYTNGWGAAIALLTPVVICASLLSPDHRARWWALIGLLLALPPAIATSNRGLFLALGVAVAYVQLRLLARGQWKRFIGTAIAVVVGFVLLSQGGLQGKVEERQELANTTDGRASLYSEALERTQQSPLLGYGAPRPSEFSEISVGTQGMVWNLMFCFGFVGLALFALFLLGAIFRTWSAPSTGILWLHASLVGATFMSVFYGLDRHMLPIAIIVGLLLRERYAGAWWSTTALDERQRR